MHFPSRIAAIFGIVSLGAIAAEVINHTAGLAIRVRPVMVVWPFLALYLLYEGAIAAIRRKTDCGESAGKIVWVMLGTTRSIYFILGIIALLGIPLLWWGGDPAAGTADRWAYILNGAKNFNQKTTK